MKIVDDILRESKINVTFLNITQLSEYRKDGHTTIYGERKGKLLTKEQRSDPKKFADCIHWCLPGVPDAWNEILYAYLLQNHQNFMWLRQRRDANFLLKKEKNKKTEGKDLCES